jgi:hypothetical protein
MTPMENTVDTKKGKSKKGFLWTLRIILAIYAVLYVLFIIDYFIPKENIDIWNTENTAIKIMFFIFIPGYIISWKNELVAGMIFIFWFICMCLYSIFICTGMCDDGIVMGIPLLILGILFIVYARRKTS